jgi:hypothetical protein
MSVGQVSMDALILRKYSDKKPEQLSFPAGN